MRSVVTVVEPAATFDLTTLDTVRSELGLTDSASDAVLAALIRQASDAIRWYCNRSFAEETVRETFRLSAPADELVLSRWPVGSVASVTEGGTALTADDYELDAQGGAIRRLCAGRSRWPVDDVVVEYTSGYALLGELPFAVERACITLVRHYWFARDRDPQMRQTNTEGVGAIAWTTGADLVGGMPAEVAGLLDRHRQPALA